MKRILILIIMCVVIFNGTAYSIESSQLFEQGMEVFRMGNYGSSELIFRKIIDANDSFRDRAWFYLALSIFHQRQYRSAIFELNRFLLICTTPDLCQEARFWIAESYYFLNNSIKAIEEYHRFISQSRNRQLIINSYDRIGEIYYAQRRYDEAIIEWRRALELGGKKSQDSRLVKIGEAYFLSERYDNALEILEPLIDATNDVVIASRARLLAGRIYQIMGRHTQAIKYINEIPESMLRSQEFFCVQYFRALSYIALGDVYNARLNLKSYILISPDDQQYHYSAKYELGKILIDTKDSAEGIALLDDVTANSNDIELRSKASFELGSLYLKNNYHEKALPYLENAVSISDPERQKYVLITLSRLYVTTARYDDAQRLLDFMLGKFPFEENRDEMLFLMAKVHLKQGDTAKALEKMEAIREVNPFSQYLHEIHYVRAVDSFTKGNFQNAIEHGIIYLRNQDIESRYEITVLLANSYISVNNTREAMRLMDQLMARFQRTPGVENELYTLSMKLREQGIAVERFLSFITRNFNSSVAAGKIFIEKGDDAYKKKNFRTAASFYAQYLATQGRPRERSVVLFYVMSLYELEQYQTIIKTLNEGGHLLIDDHTTSILVRWLARSYAAINDYTLALNTFLKIPMNDQRREDLPLIAKAALHADKPDIAGDALQFADMDNLYIDIAYDIGMYYKNNNLIDLALEYFAKVLFKKPTGTVADSSKIQIAEIYILRAEYAKALDLVGTIENGRNLTARDCIRIIANAHLGNHTEAANIALPKINDILKTKYADDILAILLDYYYKKNDVRNFQNIFRHSSRRNNLAALSHYYQGMLLFNNNKYNEALNHFNTAMRFDDPSAISSTYYAALIHMTVLRNNSAAKRLFNLYLSKADKGDTNYLDASFYLSIVLFELGRKDESKRILFDVIDNETSVEAKIRAAHLIEQYGF